MPFVARLPDMVPSAYLRVFQPLDAFEGEEQLRWERYLVSNRWLPGSPRRYRDHAKGGLGVDRRPPTVGIMREAPGRGRQDLRESMADADARAGRGPGFPRDPSDSELSGALPFEEGRETGGPRAEAAPSARPARGGLLSPEPVARADPLVRALRG